MKDSLGDRMKRYENTSRYYLSPRNYTIIRVDGKAFHTYTKGLERPFDLKLISDMNETASFLCKNIQGAKFAFVQSDEISIVITDFENINTDAWFDGNVQKITSISASLATAKFNQLRLKRQLGLNKVVLEDKETHDGYVEYGYSYKPSFNITEEDLEVKLAHFDSRCFVGEAVAGC